ncbi:MAG: PIG-L family deacetylase [Betaproteobacteria bacterium]|nr:PIG-L family deacetylase [Betaproteobacteria bacterium]
MSRKEKLLQRHRRKKRLGVILCLCALIGLGLYAGLIWVPPCLLLLWIAHEVRFSDHLFYSPAADYRYTFGARLDAIPVSFAGGSLTLADACRSASLQDDDTLILEISLRANLLGCWFDPAVHIHTENTPDAEDTTDCQTFERGAKGLRYINLTGFGRALLENGLRLEGKYCRIDAPRLLRVRHPDYRQKRLLVIAPHADDAELAAFGLYSQAQESWIVTLTAGETEAEHYRQMALSGVQAARIKGRLRAWDSIAVPLWGNVPLEQSIQLGYFCLKLAAMRTEPDKAFASEAAELSDTRPFRVFNRIKLTSDANGLPTWRNLLADLREIIACVEPEVIVLPHPLFDSHPDHVAAHAAVLEALQGMDFSPVLLCYANHLHDTDRWPMGEAHHGVALPPLFEDAGALMPYALPLEKSRRIDKAMALGMMHDLIAPRSFKERCRRVLQRLLAGRRHPPYGANAYFRKAVRRHEFFWVDDIHGEAKVVDNRGRPTQQPLYN